MKLVNKDKDSAIAAAPALTWKLLVVDDEPDIHKLTQLSLKDFRFAGRSLEILSASSGYAARDVFRENPDIAVALIDVVMETDDAGLRLVEHVRNELKNEMVRIIIRTGQPASTPRCAPRSNRIAT